MDVPNPFVNSLKGLTIMRLNYIITEGEDTN